jgi:protease-4
MPRESLWRQLVRSVLLTLLTLIVVVVLIGGAAKLYFDRAPGVEDRSWLVVDLYGPVSEYHPPGGITDRLLGDDPLTLQTILDGLGKAALDKRIAGVIWKVSAANNAGWAMLEEMRAACGVVRAAGKPVYAWGDNFDLRTFYLASACDSVFAAPRAYIRLTGLETESLHVRNLLEKLGIKPHVSKIADYKGAAEMITETKMTEPVRENRTWILNGIWDEVVPTLASDRGLEAAAITTLMARAELMPDEAVAGGLIDSLLYWPDLETRLKAPADEVLRTVDLATYADVSWEDVGRKGKETIAVVHAQGLIGGRENRVDPILGIMMGHETIATQLRRARLDDKVKAVVFRVDSNGGEGLASDLIAREVELTAAVKPVVVSMVDVAASGGYAIAFKATRLVAAPLTITGSIGSIAAFFDLREFYAKIGVTKDFVTRGPMARFGGDYHEPTKEEWERFQEEHWATFNKWLDAVAEQRGMTVSDVQRLAYGRIWTGRQAAANGLIDEVGTLRDAVRLAAELAELDPARPVKLVHLPEKKSLLDTVFGSEKTDEPVTALLRWQLYRTLQREAALSVEALRAAAGTVAY